MAKSSSLGDFVVGIVVDAAKGDLSVKGLISRFGELQIGALSGVAAVSKVADTIMSLSGSAMHTAVGLQNFTLTTKESAEGLQRLWAAGMGVGVSSSQVTSGVERIQSALDQLKNYGTGPMVGIRDLLQGTSFKATDATMGHSLKFVMELKKLGETMERSKFLNVLSTLGVSDMAPMFLRARAGFDDARASASVMNEQLISSLAEQHQLFEKNAAQWQQLGYTIVEAVTPVVLELSKATFSMAGAAGEYAGYMEAASQSAIRAVSQKSPARGLVANAVSGREMDIKGVMGPGTAMFSKLIEDAIRVTMWKNNISEMVRPMNLNPLARPVAEITQTFNVNTTANGTPPESAEAIGRAAADRMKEHIDTSNALASSGFAQGE